jgi:hypothetical protein
MHQDEGGRAILKAGLVDRFTVVQDADYDEIRRMARHAAPIRLLAMLGDA